MRGGGGVARVGHVTAQRAWNRFAAAEECILGRPKRVGGAGLRKSRAIKGRCTVVLFRPGFLQGAVLMGSH